MPLSTLARPATITTTSSQTSLTLQGSPRHQALYTLFLLSVGFGETAKVCLFANPDLTINLTKNQRPLILHKLTANTLTFHVQLELSHNCIDDNDLFR